MNRKHAKFRVPFKRTRNWWNGDWQELSHWCSYTCGISNWDYMNEEFWFTEEKFKIMFMLRWL